MEENKKFLWAVIILLVAVAGALAYGVYNRYAPTLGLNSSDSSNSVVTNDQQTKSTQDSTKAPITQTGGKKLTSVESGVLAGVPASASDAERQAYTDTVNSLAKDADQISISGCYANPLVSRASKQKGEITFRNDDSVSRLLAFNNGKDKYTLASKEVKKIKLTFPNGFGFYNYTCDNQTAGLLIVGE